MLLARLAPHLEDPPSARRYTDLGAVDDELITNLRVHGASLPLGIIHPEHVRCPGHKDPTIEGELRVSAHLRSAAANVLLQPS